MQNKTISTCNVLAFCSIKVLLLVNRQIADELLWYWYKLFLYQNIAEVHFPFPIKNKYLGISSNFPMLTVRLSSACSIGAFLDIPSSRFCHT